MFTINLFSSFDPLVWGLAVNWISSSVALAAFCSPFWVVSSEFTYIFKASRGFLIKELSPLINSHYSLIMAGMFSMVLFNNLLGLVPYVFTSSTHLVFGAALAFPVWLGHNLMSFNLQPVYDLARLVPSGTPAVLQPFMVFIEIISSNIRPLTLAVRLTANMMAGHLLLTLIGSPLGNASWLILVLGVCGVLMITLLELGVAVIQAYVFTVLSVLYISEVNTTRLMWRSCVGS